MREIKFRIYGKIDGVMREFDELLRNCSPLQVLNDEAFEIMQFTGLKDKNGKEIYEGDIVNNPWADETGVVVFENAQFQVDSFGYADDIAVRLEESEVLGNIHQNPELLNQTK